MSEPMTTIPDFQTALATLSEIAKAKGDDFRVKIMRKTSTAAPLTAIATFDGACVDHFQTPEAWLVPFCGGGPIYVLWAFHASEPNRLCVVVMPPLISGTPREPNLALPAQSTWNGPRVLISPKPPDAPAANPSADLVSLFPSGAARDSGGPARDRGHQPGAGGTGPSSEEDRLMNLRLQIIDQQRKDDASRIEKMIEAQAKATERQVAALMAVVEKMNATPRAPEKTLVEQIAALAPVLSIVGPMLLGLREKSAADAKLRAEADARREEREAKAREETTKLILAQSEKAANAGSESMKMIAPMVEAVAQMSRTSLQTAATMRDLMPTPPEEEGIIGLVKALAPAVAEYLAVKAQGPQPGQPAPAALPAHTPPPSATNGAADRPEPAAEVPIDKVPPAELVAEVDSAIQAHFDPVKLADGYLDALVGNAGFAETIRAAGGTWPYFRGKLTAWATQPGAGPDGRSNGDYLKVVVETLTKAAQARGVTL